jgi:hypothetical protein
MNTTHTITFCECAENHAGMEMIGTKASTGFSTEEIKLMHSNITKAGIVCTLLDLGGPLDNLASLLIVRNGVDVLLGQGASTAIFEEHLKLKPIWDTKALMGRGANRKVKNKNARHNLVFADFSQQPDYEVGKGTVVNFNDQSIRLTSVLRERLPILFGEKSKSLFAESNYYYDPNKTYIGFHGDTERYRVIGARFGSPMPLFFVWYHNSKTLGPIVKVNLNPGDIYIMSSKATGNDWLKRSIPTLRHGAGSEALLRKTPGPRDAFEMADGMIEV